MIDGLKPYREYKVSGLQWLGEIPGHWKLERAKGLFQKMDRPAQSNDEVVTCFRDGTVTLRKNRRLTGFTESLKEIGYQGVRRGDLVIHAMDAFAGAVGVSDATGKCTPVYAVCQPRCGANPYYYAYIVREMARTQWIAALAKGIRERSTDFRFDSFAAQQVPFPPPTEQRVIANFLHHANRRIERYIRAKKKLIALLNEQKKAIIHGAVTRGLDPNVRLKPSGIPWLGEIPEHWGALQLRRMVSLVTSGSRGWAEYYSDSGDIFLQSGNLGRSMSLNLSFIQRVKPPQGSEGVRTRVERDDVLICITGALTGNVALVDVDLLEPAYVNQHVALVRPKPAMIFPRYLALVLHSEVGRTQFKTSEYGGTKQGLGLGDVKSEFVPFPPLSEQRSICLQLDNAIAGLNEAITRAEHEIALILEYRTRLLADVVTGQLDVRAEAEKLPDESREEDDELREESNGGNGEPSQFDEIADSGTIGQE